MENNENKKIDTEELKNETLNAVNDVKETIKNVNVKQDAIETKGFIIDLFKNPLEKIKSIVDDNTNKFFKYSIFIAIIWMVVIFAAQMFSRSYLWKYGLAFHNLFSVIKATIAPVIGVIVLALIVLILNKENKKSLTHLFTIIMTVKIPLVFAAVLNILTIVSSSITSLTNPVVIFCQVISITLTYFALKDVFGEKEDSKFIKKFALIEVIYCAVYFVFTFLEIYI